VATIKLQSVIEQSVKTTQNYTYSDLHLDFTPIYNSISFGSYTQNDELLRDKEIVDVVADFDLGAIRNSLFNLFTTIPGQKILNPYFGINLMQYVFEACDEDMANIIGNQIVSGITTFEPRVTLTKVRVLADPEQQQYTVSISFNVPVLGTSFQLEGVLSTSGFAFISQQ
jgi:phage baseplate assembly protein W